jgi:cell wall hydrolase
MRNQIQQLQIQGSIRIAGSGLLAVALAFLVVASAGASQSKQTARTLSASEISEAKDLLDHLGYWIDASAKGKSASLRHALIAFQKIEGRNRTGVLTIEELEALRLAQSPRPFETGYPHIEIDLHRQVLFVVGAAGVDLRVLPVSSASGEFFTEGGETRQAITPTGRFKVYRKIEGWRKSTLGMLYYPNYIHYGIAIHGAPSVPPSPASHGCIRIPMFAAREFSKLATVGMVVLVYDSDPLAEAGAAEPE